MITILYHPFGDSREAHEGALTRLTHMIDKSYVKFGEKLRLLQCGDFNGLRDYYDVISGFTQLSPIVDFPTRESNILDQVFVNFASEFKAEPLSPLGKSDHLVIFWHPSPVVSVTPVRKMKIRKIPRSGPAGFYRSLSSYDWLKLIEEIVDIDDATSMFMNCLFNLYDAHFPSRTICIRSNEPKMDETIS